MMYSKTFIKFKFKYYYWVMSQNLASNLGNFNENSSIPSIPNNSQQTASIGHHSGVVERCLRNFILGKKIGAGTFSKVCIAKHKLTNEQVAIKIIQKSKIQNEADKNRLDREIKIMRKVRHPNIAQLYQIIQTNKYIYLVMQYAARGELFDHIVSHEKLTEFQASKFLLQLTDAVEYLHQLGISHRDLKPQNLLLDHKYNIKATDFGLSNIYPSGKLLTTACGSPSYACPQMLNNQSYDGLKADIWSVGIVLYAMCFGYLPFDNPNINELYKLIKQGQFQIPQSASENLVDLLQRILEVDPRKRATISDIRSHPFCRFSIPSNNINSIPGIIIGLSDIPFEMEIEKQMKNELNLSTQHLREEVKKNKHNENTCTYYLLLQRNLRTKNQSLSNYYLSKYNTINRYALIEKVKAYYDRLLKNKMEIKKFHAVQEQFKIDNKGTQSYNFDRSQKNKQVSKTNSKESEKKIKKIVHSAQNQKNPIIIQNLVEDENYLQSQTKHFAPHNTKYFIKDHSKTQNKNQAHKKRSKSKSKSPSRKKKMVSDRKLNNKKSLSKKPQIKKRKYTQQVNNSNYLQIPQEFMRKTASNKKSRTSKQSKSSGKKNYEESEKKKVVKSPVEKMKRSRNKSLPQKVKLNF